MIKSKSVKTILFSIASLLIFIVIFLLSINFSKPVTLIVDGVEISTRTSEDTVEEVLDENNIVLQGGEFVFPSRFSKVGRGDLIVLNNPVPVVLYLGNEDPYEVMTTSNTIGELLDEQGIVLDDNDIVEPSLDSEIIPDEEIFIKFIDVKVEEQNIELKYDVEYKYNDSMYNDEQKVIREGINGLRVIKEEKYYENGAEISSNVIYDNIEVSPVNKIVEKGTKKREEINIPVSVNGATVNGNKISFLGKEYTISRVMSVESTAFYNNGSNGNHITATGNPTVYNPSGWSTVAVDPRVIPLHTRLYVDGYGFGIAHDTGGAIKGRIIDVFMPSRDAAYKWGRKKGVEVYILE